MCLDPYWSTIAAWMCVHATYDLANEETDKRLHVIILKSTPKCTKSSCTCKNMHFFWLLATFISEYEYDYEYEFSVLSTRCRFKGRNFSKCACSELKSRTRSRPRTPIWRSLLTRDSKTYGSDGWLSSVSGSWMRNISPQKDDWLTKHGWSTEQKQSSVYK